MIQICNECHEIIYSKDSQFTGCTCGGYYEEYPKDQIIYQLLTNQLEILETLDTLTSFIMKKLKWKLRK